MELGKGKLLRSGLNALYQAIHPVHGLAWTDGKQVILTALHLQNEDPKFGNSVVIGQFEHVHGLYWGPAHSGDIPALLAVQHKKHVTVWQLYYNNSEKNKLVVSQTCEVGDPLPVLPQGCVWHPSKDILVILTKRDVSVLYSARSDNASVKADIKSTGVVHCACWTKDGGRLVVAISSALHSYIWDSKNKVLNACTFCPIFDVGGYICAIESTVDSQVAVATELPLDRLCVLNAGLAFDVPAASEISFSAQPALLLMDEEFSLDVGRKSTDSGTSLSTDSPVTSPGTLDLTHILVNQKSDLSPLLNLKHKDYITGSGQDSSHLILVNFEKKVTSTRKVSIPGILVPDMLAFDHGAHIVAVASNTCSHVLVYSLTSTNMPNIQQIQLEKNERPKGLYFLTEKMLLVLVGRQKTCDPAFLPSSSSDKYIIRLMVKEVMFDEDSSTSSTDIPSAHSSYDSSMISHGKKRYVNSFFKDEHPPSSCDILIPGSNAGRHVLSKKQLIEEIRSYNCDQSLTSTARDFEDRRNSMPVHNLDTEPKNRAVSLGLEAHRKPASRPTSPKLEYQSSHKLPNLTKNCTPLPGQDIQHMSRNLERLCCNMANLQQRLLDLNEMAQNGRKSYLSYPPVKESPYVTIICQYHSDCPPVKKCILLCDSKLRLHTLQELFCLSLVEMQLGSSCWITLTADSEGFIPLAFSANQELYIRDARSTPRSPLSADSVHGAEPPSRIT